MSDDMKTLLELEQLRSLKSQKALAEISAEEAKIRRQIGTLQQHRRLSHEADPALIPMRAIGADILWQGWIDRTQSDLNMDLARVLVRKAPIIKRARKDIGRREVVSDMKDRMHDEDQRIEAAGRLDSMLQIAAVQAALVRKAD
jgi:hypothetical protein